jgi:tetratricopeptide (TPR) repeat protein
MTAELPEPIHTEIKVLCKQGDDSLQAGDPEGALRSYVSALRLLPGSRNDWEAATWIYVAIGDVYWHAQVHDKAFECFVNAVQCPRGLGNPYIHLRLGQLYFEQGNLDKSADELTRAYMGAGLRIFTGAEPKYLAFLKARIDDVR